MYAQFRRRDKFTSNNNIDNDCNYDDYYRLIDWQIVERSRLTWLEEGAGVLQYPLTVPL